MTVMTKSEQTERSAALLAFAADRVERGWCQGMYMSPDLKKTCMVGAILDEQMKRPPEPKSLRTEYERMVYAVRRETGAYHLTEWNDTPGRTVEEVATALRAAIRWL